MQTTYAIIPIASGLLLAYLMSSFAVRLHIIQISQHRKFWNILLLVSFLITAVLGVIMAIQVNYKLEFAKIDQWMVLHVDTGIALAMIGIFHLSWHLGYYSKLFTRNSSPIQKKIESDDDINNSRPEAPVSYIDKLPVLALGVTAIVTQIVVLREFMAVFQGNELILGVILGNWMLLTGFGAWLGKSSVRIINHQSYTFSFLLILGFLSPLTIFLLHYLKNIVFLPGSLINIFEVFYSSLILLSPFCLLSGYVFTFYAQRLSVKYKANIVRKVYAWESMGSVAGGAIFSLILVYFLKSMQILAMVLLVNAFAAAFILRNKKTTAGKGIAVLIFLIIGIGLLLFPADKFNKQFIFRNQEIELLKDTPYGSLALTKSGDQHNFYENNNLITNTMDIISNEEDVHYALIQRPKARKVLLISGGISGVISEIFKYDIDKIDYVEQNPWIVKSGKDFEPELKNRKVNIINADGRKFLSNCKEKYDVILINMPPPYTVNLNRFYTTEFFDELKNTLNPGGLISFGLPATANYLSTESNVIISLIYSTLKKSFNNTIIIPGEKNYFISSDNPLHLNIVQLISLAGIDNEYVSEYFLDDQILDSKNELLMSKIRTDAEINTDLNPLAYFAQIKYWLSFNSTATPIIIILLGLVFLWVIIRLNPITAGMFAGGFAAASVEVLLLFSFQLLFGYVYLMTGIIITVFMVGLALGALQNKWLMAIPKIQNYIKLEIIVGFIAGILPLIVFLLKVTHLPAILEQSVYLLFTFIFSFLIGLLFSLASVLQKGKIGRIASSIYAVDLLGSALGAMLVTSFLLPKLGMVKTSIVIGLFCFLAAGYTYMGRRKLQ